VNALSIIAAILLTLFGYAAAAAFRAGKKGVRKPGAFDLAVVAILWAGVLFGRGRTDMNGWLFVLVAVAAGFLAGILVGLAKGYSEAERQASVVEPHLEKLQAVRRFRKLRAFLTKAGTFQSQILMGLIFLVVLGPVGLAVRLFADPLRIKKRGGDSHWIARPDVPADLPSSRKAF
jgi:hypothetical protein